MKNNDYKLCLNVLHYGLVQNVSKMQTFVVLVNGTVLLHSNTL